MIMNSIPIDLVFEICSRLPAKSIARCRCVSKLWRSMLHSPYFTELFLTRSSARPRLLFAVRQDLVCHILSSPQPQNPYEKSFLVVPADFHTKISGNYCRYNSGLIYLHHMWISENGGKYVPGLCNPNTGQYSIVPKHGHAGYSHLGYDPIDNHFKVLFMPHQINAPRDNHLILTVGTGKLRWRKIQCPLIHRSSYRDICINGVLYYFAQKIDDLSSIIGCFDFRSEKFMFIDVDFTECVPGICKLVNYKEKLGVIFWRFDDDAIELRMWVLEDAEKHVWSKYVYTLPKIQVVDPRYVSVVGVTAMGEIVLSMKYMSKPFYVFYFSPETKTLHSVEIQGFEGFQVNHEAYENRRVHTFVEYVEDLKLNDAKLLKTRTAGVMIV